MFKYKSKWTQVQRSNRTRIVSWLRIVTPSSSTMERPPRSWAWPIMRYPLTAISPTNYSSESSSSCSIPVLCHWLSALSLRLLSPIRKPTLEGCMHVSLHSSACLWFSRNTTSIRWGVRRTKRLIRANSSIKARRSFEMGRNYQDFLGETSEKEILSTWRKEKRLQLIWWCLILNTSKTERPLSTSMLEASQEKWQLNGRKPATWHKWHQGPQSKGTGKDIVRNTWPENWNMNSQTQTCKISWVTWS